MLGYSKEFLKELSNRLISLKIYLHDKGYEDEPLKNLDKIDLYKSTPKRTLAKINNPVWRFIKNLTTSEWGVIVALISIIVMILIAIIQTK